MSASDEPRAATGECVTEFGVFTDSPPGTTIHWARCRNAEEFEVIAAVLAEVATVPELTHLQALSLMDTKSRRIYYADDSARVGHAFPDERWNEENEWRDIAAIAIQQMLRLRTEGA